MRNMSIINIIIIIIMIAMILYIITVFMSPFQFISSIFWDHNDESTKAITIKVQPTDIRRKLISSRQDKNKKYKNRTKKNLGNESLKNSVYRNNFLHDDDDDDDDDDFSHSFLGKQLEEKRDLHSDEERKNSSYSKSRSTTGSAPYLSNFYFRQTQQSTPKNTLCNDAESVSDFVVGTTIGSSIVNLNNVCDAQNSNNGVWYTTQGTGARMTADTCDDQTDFDTKLSIFQGSCSDLLCVASNDDSSFCNEGTKLSSVSWESTRFETYIILVHGFLDETGNFLLRISSEEPVTPIPTFSPTPAPSLPPPANDLCMDSETIVSSKIGTTRGATTDDVEGLCKNSDLGRGVWYVTKGTGARLTADTCDKRTNFDTELSVFKGDCSTLSCVGYNDDACGEDGKQSSFSWNSTNGEVYTILVHGFLDRAGEFNLKIFSADSSRTISSDKSEYVVGEIIVIAFSNDAPFSDDVIALYEVQSTSSSMTFASENRAAWLYACGTTSCSQPVSSGSAAFRDGNLNPGFFRPVLQRNSGSTLVVGDVFKVVRQDVPTQAPTPELSVAIIMSDLPSICPLLYEHSALRGDECCNPRTEKRQCEEKDYCFGLMLSHPDAKFSPCCEHYSSCSETKNLFRTLDTLLLSSRLDFAFSVIVAFFVLLKLCAMCCEFEGCAYCALFSFLIIFELCCFAVGITILVIVRRSGAVKTAQQIIDAGCFTGTSDGQLIGNVIDELETYYNLAICEVILDFVALVVHICEENEDFRPVLMCFGVIIDLGELVLAAISLFLYLVPAVDAFDRLYLTLDEFPALDIIADGKESLPCVFACCGGLLV